MPKAFFERLAKLDFGQLDIGQLDLGQLNYGQLNIGQLDLGQLDLGQLNFGQLDIGQLGFGQESVEEKLRSFEQLRRSVVDIVSINCSTATSMATLTDLETKVGICMSVNIISKICQYYIHNLYECRKCICNRMY
jgi:hypothetical protein